MTLALSSRRAALSPGQWVRNELWRRARAVPSLDLRFAESKSLRDAASGSELVTFTRASSGTFVGSDGLIKTATTNLLLRSEEFDNAYWNLLNNVSVSANSETAPNGTLTAEKLTETAVSNVHYIARNNVSVSAAGIQLSLSVYAKAAERNFVGLQLTDGTNYIYCTFNLQTGVASTPVNNGTGSGASASIQSVGNGWYRCTLSGIYASSGTTPVPAFYVGNSNVNLATSGHLGVTGSGIYLWGAQLEQSSTVGEYIPTTSAINSAPRFDHNPTTGESLGLLVEESRTNSVTNNTMVGAVAGTPGTNPTGWAYATAQSNGLTISIAGTGVENGINYIDYRFNGTTVASPNACAIGITNATAATAQTWTASTYWKLAAGTTAGTNAWQLGLIENTAGGVFVTGAFYSQTAPTSAALITQRPTATRTLSGGGTVGMVTLPINIPVAGNTAIDFTLRIGLPQLEQGAFATSVIPTSTVAVTRSADVASITGSAFSSWYSQSEGTVFAQTQVAGYGSTTNPDLVSLLGADSVNNRINMFVAGAGPNYRAVIRTGGVDQLLQNVVGLANIYDVNNFAIAYKENDSVSYGRNANTTDTLVTPPVTTSLNFSASGSVTKYIRRITYWPTRLPNSTLQSITQ